MEEMTNPQSEFKNPQIFPSDFPSIGEIDYQNLASTYPKLSAIQAGIFWLIPQIPLLGVKLFVTQAQIPWFVFVIFPSLAVLSALFSYFAAKAKSYALRERDIIYKKGLLWQKQTCISFKRIQHIDVSHGPIERHFGLTSIKFFTAGGAMADLSISGLNKDTAEKLRHHILTRIGLEIEEREESSISNSSSLESSSPSSLSEPSLSETPLSETPSSDSRDNN